MRKWTDDDLREAVPFSDSVADVLRKLGLVPAGGNYRTIQDKIIELGLDTSHFKGQGWNNGKSFGPKKNVQEYLKENFTCSSSWLRKRLIKEGLKEERCEGCKLDSWRGGVIPLELDHINGDNKDNRIENLRVLCPNCHALTDTYRGKNIGMRGGVTGTGIPRRLKNVGRAEAPNVGSNPTAPTPVNQCIDCYSWICRTATRCKSCSRKDQIENKITWPSEEEALALYFEVGGNVTKMAKMLGVSDNAIRKRYPIS